MLQTICLDYYIIFSYCKLYKSLNTERFFGLSVYMYIFLFVTGPTDFQAPAY